jgi:hypothetical protein
LTSAQQHAIGIAGGHGTLDPTLLTQLGLTAAQKASVTAAFDSAFMDGFHVALLVGGLVLWGAAVVAYRSSPAGTPSTSRRRARHAPVAVEDSASHLGPKVGCGRFRLLAR